MPHDGSGQGATTTSLGRMAEADSREPWGSWLGLETASDEGLVRELQRQNEVCWKMHRPRAQPCPLGLSKQPDKVPDLRKSTGKEGLKSQPRRDQRDAG